MDPSSREDLSALMDGELAAEPTRFLLRRLDHDPALSATWSRWHLIRACLASDPARMSTPSADRDFASRIAAALVSEGASRPRRRHWAQYVGGGALAAGVAVAALLLNVPNSRVGSPAPVAETSPATPVPTTLSAMPPAAGQVAPPWLLARQPTVLSAQPASASVIYGTGLMQPDYLRRAAYSQDVVVPLTQRPGAVVMFPPAPASSTAAAGH